MRYWAFISYSHHDRAWGEWLHRSLESYRIPRRLVGRSSRGETVPSRLFPVFRDRDELPGSSNLGEQIQGALRDSRYLLVICSPAAASSRWVNEEITAFKRLGRSDRILCLIVDGEPNAGDEPDVAKRECFPAALRYHLDADGISTGEQAEPIAADVRPGQDPRRKAFLKLVAGVLDVGFDELRQRDRLRRRWSLARAIAAGAALVALLLAAWHWQEREKARQLQAELAERYVEEGRQELLAERPERAAALLAEAYRLGANGASVRHLLAASTQPAYAEPITLAGHSGELTSAQFSPDGRMVATTSYDGTAAIWDARTGHRLAALGEGTATMVLARFNTAGTRLLTAGWDAARLWDTSTWKMLRVLDGHGARITVAAFSPDGRRVVTAGLDPEARLWDAETGQPIRSLAGHTDGIVAVCFDPAGRRILTAGLDATARIWDGSTGAPLGALVGHGDRLVAAQFSPDGTRAVTASFDKTARVWDPAALKALVVLQGHELPVAAVAFSPDGTRVATAGWDKTARVWDVASAREVATLTGHALAVVSVAWDPSGTRVATAGWDKAVKVWDAASGKLLGSLEGHSNIVQSAVFSPDGNSLASGSFDGTAKVWSVRLEDRPATTIEDMIRCHAPWRIEQGRLVAAATDPSRCVGRAAPAT